jgi:hypothetical protein
MPKIQTKPSHLRLFFGWFGRHKVIAVFAVLILAGVLYWAVTSIIWNMQIRAERSRYVATAHHIEVLGQTFPPTGEIKSYRQCSYTSNGAVFATRSLGCETEVYVSYPNVSPKQANSLAARAKNTLLDKGILLKENTHGYDTNDIAVYTFNEQEIDCDFFATYYDASVPITDRDSHASQVGSDLLMGFGCSGPAKAEYFPVVQD